MIELAIILAALIGLSLGLLGSGGSIITLPVLVYVAGVPPHQAVGMSLVIVGGTSALGGLFNLRRGDFDVRAATFFAVSGTVGAFVGSRFTHMVSSRVLLLSFAALMVIVGLRMLLAPQGLDCRSECRPWRCLGTGLAVGLLTGFLGVGGGFVVLPALVLFAGLEMKTAVGTSLAVIAVNSFAGLAGHLTIERFDWLLTLEFLAASAAGMFAGLALVERFQSRSLRHMFGCVIICLGAFLLVKNLLR